MCALKEKPIAAIFAEENAERGAGEERSVLTDFRRNSGRHSTVIPGERTRLVAQGFGTESMSSVYSIALQEDMVTLNKCAGISGEKEERKRERERGARGQSREALQERERASGL